MDPKTRRFIIAQLAHERVESRRWFNSQINWLSHSFDKSADSIADKIVDRLDTQEQARLAEAERQNYGGRLAGLEQARDERVTRRVGISAVCALAVSIIYSLLTGK